MQAPTSKRQDFHKNYIALSKFHRRGEHCSPALAVSANPKISPAPLAGLQCRPLQAKGMIFIKIISFVCNSIVGASIARPLKPCDTARVPRVEQSPTPTINRERVLINFSTLSQFHRRGGAWLRPLLPYQQAPKYTPHRWRACHAGPYKQLIQANKQTARPGAQNFFQACPGRACFLFFPFQVGALCGALTRWGLKL